MMKNFLIILLAGIALSGCNKPHLNESQESKIVAMIDMNSMSTGTDYNSVGKDRVIFTGNDIASFNAKTREVTFKNLVPTPFALPMHCQIDIYMNAERLLNCVHINGSDNAVYNDLVLYYDLNTQKYFLNDFYPFNWDHSGVKENIEARATGWNKFLNQLKKEGKLKY